jgi:molybdenum cofactor cytidylyltransferase
MKLNAAFDIRPGQAAALIGAGGKTTVAWRIQSELAQAGQRAIITTTTKIMEPALPADGALMLAARPDAARIARVLAVAPRLILAARRWGEFAPPDPHHPVPSLPFKLDGLPPDVLDDLFVRLPGVTWLVEADGAKGCGLKLPAAHEPVIPRRVDAVIVIAHLDILGQPLDGTTVHRVADAVRALDAPIGSCVTPAMMARVLTDEALGLKGVPVQARAMALLTQRETMPHPDAAPLAEQLLHQARYERVVIASLRASEPVMQVVRR